MNERLAELILRWEESLFAGVRPSPADLCADCPELLDEFQFALSRLQTLDQFMFPDRIALLEECEATSAAADLRAHFPTVPGYELLSELGEGGMGIVYLGRQKSLKRDVAIKTLPGRRWHQSGYIDRLRQEAKGLSLIDHPNVVKIIDVVETPVAIAIILEYIEGENLASRLKRSAMAPGKAAELALELARTIAFVHERGLWHRDIKPANILIDLEENIKIADFGLVKEEGSFNGLTGTGDFFGTPSYMAPEQIPGSNQVVDGRADVYAIGATLYEMLSGRPPFMGVSPLATMEQVQERDPVPLRVLNPGIPRDLETICLRCLEKEPARRFESAQELADEFERFLNGVPIHSRRIGMPERYWRWSMRRPAIASLAVLSLVTSVAILSLIALNIRSREAHIRDLDIAAQKAIELQHIAEKHERQAKNALYIADINRAGVALRHDNTRELTRLLAEQVPAPGEHDRRGFEWWHLHRRARRNGLTLLEVGIAQYLLTDTPSREDLCVSGADSILRMFDPVTGKIHREIPTGQMEINGVAFSPQRNEFATAGDDGTIMAWDRQTSKERLKFKAHPGKAFQIVYARDGSQIIACGNDPVIRIFDVQTGDLVFTLEGHQKSVQSLILSDDGTTLVSTSDDHTVRLWSLDDRTEKMSYVSPGEIGPVILDSRRNLLLIGDTTGELTTIDMKSRQKIDSVKHLDKIASLALHPDGKIVAVGDSSGQIRLRNLEVKRQLIEDPYPPWHAHQGSVNSLIWSTDGARLISTGDDGRVVSWSRPEVDSTEPKEFPLTSYGKFCLRPDSNSLIVRCFSKDLRHPTVARLDWNLGKVVEEIDHAGLGHPTNSPDGGLLAVVEISGSNESFTRSDKIEIHKFHEHSRSVFGEHPIAQWAPAAGELLNLRYSPDSKSIAVSKWHRKSAEEVEDHACWLLDLQSIEQAGTDKERSVRAITKAERIPVLFARDSRFSPDGTRLALVTKANLVLWDISKREIVWQTPNSFIQELAYSSDGSFIAVCGSNRMVQVVNAADGSTRFQSTNHHASVVTIAISPDSRLLASGAEDGTIKFWHVASGQELLELQHPGDGVRHIEFTEDGQRLIGQFGRQGLDRAESDRILIFDGSRFEP